MAIEGPYRAPPASEKSPPPPREHAYEPKITGRLATGLLPFLVITVFGTIAGGAFDYAPVGLALGAGIGFFVMKKIRKGVNPVHFRVDGTRVRIDRNEKDVLADVPLDDVLDITMITNTYQARENITGQIVGFNIQAPRRHDTIESRIAVHVRDRDPIFLTTENTQHMEAEEQLAKMRAFLRKHEWLPQDERPPVSSVA